MTTPFTVKTAEDFKTLNESFSTSYIVASAGTYETTLEKNEPGILNSVYAYAAGGIDRTIKVTIDGQEYEELLSSSANTCGIIQISDLSNDGTNIKTKSGNIPILPTTSSVHKHFYAIKFNSLKLEIKGSNTASFYYYHNVMT